MREREIADELLLEWYRWSAVYRPKMGVPRVAPYCEQSVSSRQWEDSTDASCGRLTIVRMHAVEFCVDQLIVPLRCAIGLEMRNRGVKAKVWSHFSGATYVQALDEITPIMVKKGLMD